MRVALFCLAFAALVACAPFNRGTVDNRPEEILQVTEVHDNGDLLLSDGRLVRLFGVKKPLGKDEGTAYIQTIKNQVHGRSVSTKEVLPGDPPAVAVVVWEQTFICGNGLDTWDANAKPFNRYSMVPLSRDLASRFATSRNESDMKHPEAAKYLRDAHLHSFEYSAGSAKSEGK